MNRKMLTYLEIKKGNFYKVESTVDGKTFVTARGWDDLSRMISVYEKCGIAVDKKLISQYLQNPQIAADFSNYYTLFNKYRKDYQIEDILAGKASSEVKQRAKEAKFDERFALIGLLLDGVTGDITEVMLLDKTVAELMILLRQFRLESMKTDAPGELLLQYAKECREKAEKGKKANSLDAEGQRKFLLLADICEKQAVLVKEASDNKQAFDIVKADFDRLIGELKQSADKVKKKLDHMFKFGSEVFGNGQEVLVMVTELTLNCHSAAFIGKFGCKEYFEHNKNLLFFNRQKEISSELEKYEL